MQEHFLKLLQWLRERVKKPFVINSGYRCEKHNEAVGGFSRSRHMLGCAADVSTRGWNSAELYQLIKEAQMIGFNGIGISETFIHLDDRESSGKMWVY
jgi:uncharacterized protein YcbK (DUF882 family)